MMCKQDFDSVIVLLDEVVDAGKPVYKPIHKLYEENEILNLS